MTLGETALELFAVLGVSLALSAAWLAKARRPQLGRAERQLAILERVSIDARRSLLLIKVADEVVVTGVSEAGFQRLGAFPFAEYRAISPAPSLISFANSFKRTRHAPPAP